MKKCFGIVSWLPEETTAREQRQERINRLFKQLEELWPAVDILIITQNWKEFKPIKIKNKINRIDFKDGLGILKARQTLRTEFLKTDYDYIIMFDDDAIIKQESPELANKFMQNIDMHPQGFCFVKGNNSIKYNPYCGAQLNLCAISKYIYQQEPMVNVDPQKNQGYEDMLFATLLHHKYANYEFDSTPGIYCIQFQNLQEKAPSTWSDKEGTNFVKIHSLNSKIADFILEYKDLPDLDLYQEFGIIVSKNATIEEIATAKAEIAWEKTRGVDSSKNYFLYF